MTFATKACTTYYDMCIRTHIYVYTYIHRIYIYMQFFIQGVGPTAQRAAVIAAVELPIYDYTKSKCMSILGDSVSNHFV